MISKNAIIQDGAKIGKNVKIGNFVFISKDAEIGDECEIMQGACIYGNTKIAQNTKIFSYAVIGSIPQDLKYKGEKTELIIGKNNKIREYCLINPGTKGGGGKTVIGDNNLLMGYVHIAHDCIIGSNCILANGVTLAGHVEIEDGAVIGGLTPIHQFVKIGELAMIAGASAVAQDIPPFCMAQGNRAVLRGLNLIGIRRKYGSKKVDKLKKAYKEIFQNILPLKESAQKVFNETTDETVKKMAKFVLETTRGIPFRKRDND
jgi:UDP-N-acetylglucosamine acyltransferase